MSQQPSNWGQSPQYVSQSGKTSMLAVFALIMGIVGCIPPLGLIGIGLGIGAIIAINNSNGRLSGLGLAIAGIVTGGFTSLLLVPLMIGILLPGLGAARRTARQMQNSTQLRGIHQALVIDAQGNNGFYAGLDRNGKLDFNHVFNGQPQPDEAAHPAHPAWRLRLLAENNHFAGTYLISPSEQTKTPWQSGPLTTANYSFAMLSIADMNDPRAAEWRNSNNAKAPILTDRLLITGGIANSVHTTDGWRGSLAWNDNHVTFEPDFIVDTKYDKQRNRDDDLFQATSGDAYMVYDQQ